MAETATSPRPRQANNIPIHVMMGVCVCMTFVVTVYFLNFEQISVLVHVYSHALHGGVVFELRATFDISC